MILRNLIFDPEIVEGRLRAGVMSDHEQQASERGNEQQPHELWPAYNVTLVREQASSLVLFQQQRYTNSNSELPVLRELVPVGFSEPRLIVTNPANFLKTHLNGPLFPRMMPRW